MSTFSILNHGSITQSTQSTNAATCVIIPFDREKLTGLVRKQLVIKVASGVGIEPPSQADLDNIAAFVVFKHCGLSDEQSDARVDAGKHVVNWHASAKEIFQDLPDPTFDVPCALVVFSLRW